MNLAQLVEHYESDEARNAAVRAAREKRDVAAREYDRTRRLLARLEGRESRALGRQVNEPRLEAARNDVHRSRLALRKAQRELLRSIGA